MKNKAHIILLAIFFLSLVLNSFGITWGLPDRWNVDEAVSATLKMAQGKQIAPENDPTHPTFYYFFLVIFLGLYYFVLKFTGYPLNIAVSGVTASWVKFANSDPFLASSLYIVARMLSALLGAATVLFVYLIVKKIYCRRAALFSSLALALSAGFIADSHYAKSSALVNFLAVLTVYFCIKAVYDGKFRRDFFIASFLGGLSLATKFNGGILIFPLITTYLCNYSVRHKLKYNSFTDFISYIRSLIISVPVIYSIGFYLFGLFIGFPALFLKLVKYLPGLAYYKANYFSGYPLSLGSRITEFLNGIASYFYMLITIFGIFLFLAISIGLIFMLRKRNYGKLVIFSLIIPYFLIISAIQVLKQPNSKYIILIVPFLAVFGGVFADRLLESNRISRGIAYLLLSLVLLFTVQHLAFTEMIFLKNDIRYNTTSWIEKNIPPGASIEIFSELDWCFSSRIVNQYNVMFFGNSSKTSNNANQFKAWNDQDKVREYFTKTDIKGPASDYLVISSVDFVDQIFKNLKQEERSHFFNDLMMGKWNYKIVKKISYHGMPAFSHIIDYTPKFILIFKHD